MPPDELKKLEIDLRAALDTDIANAEGRGEHFLEKTVVRVVELFCDRAQRRPKAEAALWFKAARDCVEAAHARMPERLEVSFVAGNLALTQSIATPARGARVAFLVEAEIYYRRVLELQPKHMGALANLGVIYICKGDLEPSRSGRLQAYHESELFFQRVLELQSDDFRTLANLGVLMETRGTLVPTYEACLGPYRDGERLYRCALELQPDHVNIIGNLAFLLHVREDQQRLRAARTKVHAWPETYFSCVLKPQLILSNTLGVDLLLDTDRNLEVRRTKGLTDYGYAELLYRRVLRLQPNNIATLVNLGVLLWTSGGLKPSRAERLQTYNEAESLHRRVLELQPDDIAALVNIGVLEHDRARLADGPERRRHLANAAAYSGRVLAFQPTEIKAMRNLMGAQLDALRLDDGGAAWPERAASAGELLERRRTFAAVTTDPHFRNQLSAAAWPLGPLGAVCHLRAGNPAAAVAHLDANMAMSLAEALATPERRLVELERQGEASAAHRFVLARDTVDSRIRERADLLQVPKGDTDEAEVTRQEEIEALGQEIARLEEERDASVATIRAIEGFDDFLRPGGDIGLIKAAAKERPLVYLAASPWGGHALVVHGDAIDDVPLDNLTDAAVAERLEGWQECYRAIEVAAEAHGVARFAVVEGSSADERDDRDQTKRALDEALAAFDTASRALCRWLGEVVMQPVLAALERCGAGRAVLLPSGQLTYLPLHAAIVGGSDDRPALALERLQLSYAANARLAHESAACLRRQPPPGRPGILAIVDPAYGDIGHRHAFGPAEVAMLEDHAAAGRLELTCHVGPNARVTLTSTSEDGAFPVRDLARHQILHLGCHGRAEHVVVFNSRLQLAAAPDGAGDQLVTIEEVLDHWPVDQLRLVVLSCCEGAMSGQQSFDELVSLQTAFAQGGAAAVVGAMWAVRDDHTAALMHHFYDAMLTDPALDPAKALAIAQTRLLDTTPEAFPTIAAFQALQG